jgi:hypothetical protein
MSTARKSPEHHASAAAHRDLATRYHYRASKLFEKDHAYAARLVQIATAIRSAVPSTATVNLPGAACRSRAQRDDVHCRQRPTPHNSAAAIA